MNMFLAWRKLENYTFVKEDVNFGKLNSGYDYVFPTTYATIILNQAKRLEKIIMTLTQYRSQKFSPMFFENMSVSHQS